MNFHIVNLVNQQFDYNFHVDQITLYEDNQSTIKLAHMATGKSRVKHIDIKKYFGQEKVQRGVIDIKCINLCDWRTYLQNHLGETCLKV